MTDEKVIDLIQAFYPLNHQQGSKKSHNFEGFNQWQDEFPLIGYSFRYFTVTHESLLEIIGWPEGLTDDFPNYLPLFSSDSVSTSCLFLLHLPLLLLLVMLRRSKKKKRSKRKRLLQINCQRSVLFLLLHLSLLPNEENIVVVVPQELATNVDVPRVDVTLLVSLVPVISTAVLVRVRQSEVRMTMMKIR